MLSGPKEDGWFWSKNNSWPRSGEVQDITHTKTPGGQQLERFGERLAKGGCAPEASAEQHCERRFEANLSSLE